jgi:hypothetical protein
MAGSAWCFVLLPGAVEEWIKLQQVQSMGIQSAQPLHLFMQVQHGDWDFLRRTSPTTRQSLHFTCDLTWYLVSSPLTTPWDPGLHFRRTIVSASQFHSVLGDLSTSLAIWEAETELQAHVPRAPAWGQAGVEEGDNVTTRPKPTKHQAGHGTGVPLNRSYSEDNGDDKQISEPTRSLSEPFL